MSIGTSNVKTLADFGPKESSEYAHIQNNLESFGLGQAPFIEKQVEVLNVQSVVPALQLDSNLHVPASKPLAEFAPPAGFLEQRRALFSSSIAPALGSESQLNSRQTQLDQLQVTGDAQGIQKQVIGSCYSKLQELEGWLTTVRNKMGSLRQA